MLNEDKKIYYYGEHDKANVFNEERLEYLFSKQDVTLDDTLECFAAQLFLEDELHHDTKKSKEKIGRNIAKCKNFIKENFPEIQDTNVQEYLEDIKDLGYVELFWKLVEQSDMYKNLSDEGFKKIAYSDGHQKFNLRYILYNKNLSQKWHGSIIEYLVKNPRWIPNIIDKYINKTNYNLKINLPNSIDNPDVFNELIKKYIDSAEVVPSTLFDIFQFRNQGNFRISNELRFKAKARYKEVHPKLSKRTFIGKWERRRLSISEKIIDCSNNWLKIPYNFVNFLCSCETFLRMIDNENRLRISNIKTSTLEDLFSNWSPDSYKAGIEFKTELVRLQYYLKSYDYDLNHWCHMRIEDIIEWFFNKYLPEKFNIKSLIFKTTYKSASFLEKCRMILPQFDSILRGYDYYVKYNEIDNNFLNSFSDAINIQEVKSQVDNKYIYFKQGAGTSVERLLFNDQASLPMGECKNFYEFMNKKDTIIYDNLRPEEKQNIDFLRNYEILKLNKKSIEWDSSYTDILKEIYYHGEFQPYYHLDSISKVNELKDLEIVEYGSTLFPKSESDFYDYMFNDKQFNNGLRIRNRYIHGNNNLDESVNEINYYYILILMIQLMFRIREDCMLAVSVKNSKK